MFLYAKDPYEAKYQFLINQKEMILKMLLECMLDG